VLVGDEKKYLSMLMTLKVKYDHLGRATQDLDPNVTSFLFRKFNITVNTITEAKKSDDVGSYLWWCVEQYNK